MIKSIGDNYRIYGLIIVKTTNTSLVLDYGLSNTNFEPLNHAFAQMQVVFWSLFFVVTCFSSTCQVYSNMKEVQFFWHLSASTLIKTTPNVAQLFCCVHFKFVILTNFFNG
jgi:hypothetical protein